MMNRTRRYMERYCDSELKASQCATDVFGAQPIGRNWRDIIKKVSLAPTEIYTPV